MYCLTDFCCICFYNKGHLQPLSCSDSDNITYITKLTSCVPEKCVNQINHQRLICNKCCETMDTAYKFRQRCLKSNATLIDYISQLHQISNINGAANVYLTDINKSGDLKKAYQKENNIKQTETFINVVEDANEEENVEINSLTAIGSKNSPTCSKLIETGPNCIQLENVIIKVDHKNQNSEEYVDDSLNNLFVNQDDNKIDDNLTVSAIKKENEYKDFEEHLYERFDSNLYTFKNEKEAMSVEENNDYPLYSENCFDDPLANRDEIKTNIVDNDNELMNDEINTQYKSEDFEEFSTEDDVIPLIDTDEDKTDRVFGSANIQYKGQWLTTNSVNYAKLAKDQKPDWNRAISEAQKIVGYPISFLSLRWLLSNELANVVLHLRKLVESNHPLLKTAKRLLYNGKNNMQAWGLIVLLISKAAGHSPNIPEMELDKSAGILYSQRALAEITEIIRASHIVHRSVVNLQASKDYMPEYNDIMFGNKMALLSGDYLLSISYTELAALKNQDLVELINAALRDQCESEFVGPRDKQNYPLPAKPSSENKEIGTIGDSTAQPLVVVDALGNARSEWTLRHVLSDGSLLGKSCQGALILAEHPPQLQEQGYLFGKHLALAWQASLHRETFLNPCNGSFSLVSAPVMFQLEYDHNLYSVIEKGTENVLDVDYKLLHKAVLSGPGLEKTRQLQKEHSQVALKVLQQLPQSDARTALTNIIFAM